MEIAEIIKNRQNAKSLKINKKPVGFWFSIWHPKKEQNPTLNRRLSECVGFYQNAKPDAKITQNQHHNQSVGFCRVFKNTSFPTQAHLSGFVGPPIRDRQNPTLPDAEPSWR